MLSRLITDEVPTLQMSEVPAEFERLTGSRPHRSTVKRWRSNGIQGITLRAIRIGGRWKTSPVWIADFIEQLNAVGDGDSTSLAPSVRRANDRAKTELELNGIL